MARYPQIEHLVGRTREVLRARAYSPRTEEAYLGWIERFLRWHGSPHPQVLEPEDVAAYMEHLARRTRLSAKTRNQAASALSFLFREVLKAGGLESVARPRPARRVPTVLSRREVGVVLQELRGRYRLIGSLMYGTGMRVNESLGLRVKDLDFELAQITVRDGKGRKDRYAVLPERLQPPLRRQIERVANQHREDRKNGHGWVQLPGALHRKSPDAGWSLGWQFLFPATRLTEDPATGRTGRYHLHDSAMQRAMKQAVRESGILKHATCHTLRHSFASQLLRDGYDIRQVKELLGHKDVRTTMIYLHAVDQSGLGIRSPLDRAGFDAVTRDPLLDG
ncbi:MAG: integron integrase [Gemmatimonadota bacterium]|jgi:integron integrase